MSWVKNLCATYDACRDAVGICDENGDQSTMLLPLGHVLTGLDIIVHLGENGSFQKLEKVTTKTVICTPCTDASESRSGTGAIGNPHPLFDQVKYMVTPNYLDNLLRWRNYLENLPNHHLAYRAISAVYQYIQNGSLQNDLQSYELDGNDGLFIAFCVDLDSLEDRLWMMPELWEAWIDFYFNTNINTRKNQQEVCFVTGELSTYAITHPKNINRFSGNAKLITGNDSINFTYRGRFNEPREAVTVSFEASQKAHQTLRWLLNKNNCYRCDSQAIIAWAIDDMSVPDFFDVADDIYNAVSKNNTDVNITVANVTYADYARALKQALSGYSTVHKLKKHKRHMAIIAVDSATNGRMSITYYRELSTDEYLERVESWHTTCIWYQPSERNEGRSSCFIGAPKLKNIELAVLGKSKSKSTSRDKLVKNLREQLVHCIFDGKQIPISMVRAAANRASNPLGFEDADIGNAWESVLGTACALIRRYYIDYKGEEFAVELEQGRSDRDYLYGRLLAVADRIESLARYKQGKSQEDARTTNAIRYMTAFSQHPFRTWNMLFTQQLNPYIQQLNGAGWYLNLVGDITQLFEPGAFENDAALDGRYLLGFFAQRHELSKKNVTDHVGGVSDESK